MLDAKPILFSCLLLFIGVSAVAAQGAAEAIKLSDHGLELFDRGHYEEAVKTLRRSIEIEKRPATYNNLGVVLLEMGDYESAVEVLKVAVDMEPTSGSFHRNFAYALYRTGHPERALAEFKTAFRLEPDNVNSRAGLGLMYATLGRSAEAVSLLEETAALHPQNLVVLTNLGYALRQAGRYRRSIDVLERAVKFHPTRPEPRLELALSYLLNKDRDAAIEQYARVSKLDPEMAKQLFKPLFGDKTVSARLPVQPGH